MNYKPRPYGKAVRLGALVAALLLIAAGTYWLIGLLFCPRMEAYGNATLAQFSSPALYQEAQDLDIQYSFGAGVLVKVRAYNGSAGSMQAHRALQRVRRLEVEVRRTLCARWLAGGTNLPFSREEFTSELERQIDHALGISDAARIVTLRLPCIFEEEAKEP